MEKQGRVMSVADAERNTAQEQDRSLFIDGKRIGVLLIHGLGGTPTELRFVARGLAMRGYTVLVPQLAGHCGTREDLRRTGWRDWFASVETARERLARQCDVVLVGGLSMGAVLALHLAAARPDGIAGVLAFAPTLTLNGWGVPWHAQLFALVTQKWFADLFAFAEREPYGIKDGRVRALVSKAIQSGDSAQAGHASNPGSSMLEMRWLVNTVRRELPRIRQPVLILHPREDDRADLSNAFYLARRLAGPTEVFVLDDSYHIITLDRQRDLVVERSAMFIDWVGAHCARSPAGLMQVGNSGGRRSAQ